MSSKIAVLNAELRLPFTEPEELAIVKSNRFFSSINAFEDAGIAWWKDDPPVWKFSTKSDQRILVISIGIAYRINLFGSLVAEIYAANPLQRPQKNFQAGFIITQGW